jgi:hypothetical protein
MARASLRRNRLRAVPSDGIGSATARRPRALRAVVALLWVSVAADVLYWLTFFTSGAVQTSGEASYLAFERAFPAADTWLGLCAAACALTLPRRSPRAVLWGLLAGSAFIYLGLMDALYNLENGKYGSIDAAMAVEVAINIFSLGFGAFIITYAWRNRRWFRA